MPLLPGRHLVEDYREALFSGSAATSGQSVARMLWNTAVMAVAIAVGKIAISLLSAYAVVFFRFSLRMLFFWMIF